MIDLNYHKMIQSIRVRRWIKLDPIKDADFREIYKSCNNFSFEILRVARRIGDSSIEECAASILHIARSYRARKAQRLHRPLRQLKIWEHRAAHAGDLFFIDMTGGLYA